MDRNAEKILRKHFAMSWKGRNFALAKRERGLPERRPGFAGMLKDIDSDATGQRKQRGFRAVPRGAGLAGARDNTGRPGRTIRQIRRKTET